MEESIPPESRVQSGTSDTSWRLTASVISHFVFSIAVSRESVNSSALSFQ